LYNNTTTTRKMKNKSKEQEEIKPSEHESRVVNAGVGGKRIKNTSEKEQIYNGGRVVVVGVGVVTMKVVVEALMSQQRVHAPLLEPCLAASSGAHDRVTYEGVGIVAAAAAAAAT
jgi:hypothetical protein